MKKLPKKIRKLAKKAGFIFWGQESWGPGKEYIDWGCEYHEEMVRFVELLKKHYGTKNRD